MATTSSLLQPNARRLFDRARRGRYALGAFNAGTYETIRAIIGAANQLRSPVILEASSGEIKYLGLSVFSAIIRAFRMTVKIPVLMNLDHAHDPVMVREAIQAGFDLVHYDGSLLPPAKNAAQLRKLVPLTRRAQILIEGEREHIQGSSSLHRKTRLRIAPEDLTDPSIARDFIASTGVDILALSVGEAHGLYRGKKHIDPKRIAKIRKATNAFLSLHGGSDIPAPAIRAAIRAGITKINVNTELRLAYARGLRQSLKSETIVPYEYLPPAIEAVEKVVKTKIKLFGSAGRI